MKPPNINNRLEKKRVILYNWKFLFTIVMSGSQLVYLVYNRNVWSTTVMFCLEM